MVWAALFVLCLVLFNQILRAAQRFEVDLLPAVAVNYGVAAILSGVLWWTHSEQALSRSSLLAITLGGVNGALYFAHLLIIGASYRVAGVGITAALVGTGSVLPVVVSWALWGEAMPPARWLAIILLIPAVALLRPGNGEGHGRLSLGADVILALACLMAGVIATVHKTVQVYGSGEGNAVYQFALFATAAACSGGYALLKRSRWAARAVGAGTALGTANCLATLCLLAALATVPATVLFPVTTPSNIAANTVVARLLWRERLSRRQLAGMALALIVVILASVKVAC
ncbi:MAG: hypothetical protein HN976_37050 [Lentisphaerae bacterium]|jgi:drug/metabolite transporter (DMT)-like permease|nr:hypothetical protein [Lentisphaerota bacterium]MBT4821052.1 hypothetical protein [Lentisphaerota bacterium]MBT7060760.1 hypothetical protein [Lentisphaerota bacterium]